MPADDIQKLRRAHRDLVRSFDAKAPIRVGFTVQGRGGMSPGDLWALEAIPVNGQNADGSFVTLPGYDDLDSYL
jgi:hypothetical protein